jgi:flagellar biosynthesis protein FlhF
METRTFRAPNLLIALQSIQKELGPQAIVVSMRKVPSGPAWQVWKKPGFEVMASRPDEKKESSLIEAEANPKGRVIQPVTRATVSGMTNASSQEKTTKVQAPVEKTTTAWMVKEIGTKEIRTSPSAPAEKPPVVEKAEYFLPDEKSQVGKAYRHLMRQGVAEKVIKKITNICLQTLNPGALVDNQKLTVHLKKLLEANLRSNLKISVGYGQIICMVGTNGSGKTSACAKLAAYYKHVEAKNVVWIGADTIRTAAISEARIYSDSLGIAFKPVYTPEELNEAVSEAGVDVFMVDLPGVNPRNEKSLVDLGSLITPLKRRITYLVVSATTKDTDLQQCYASLGAFKLDGILVSKMDETQSVGNIYNFALLTQMPLVWFSKGRNILEDLEPGSPKQLVDALLDDGGY